MDASSEMVGRFSCVEIGGSSTAIFYGLQASKFLTCPSTLRFAKSFYLGTTPGALVKVVQ